MKMSESTVNITKALIQFQVECPNVEKNSQGYNYKYADLTETLNTIRPILSKLGLWVGQNNHHTDTHVGVSTLIHHVSGEYIHFDPVMIPIEEAAKGKNIAQETGTDITYARRYSLCTALNLAMEDTDGVKGNDTTKKTTTSYSKDSSKKYEPKNSYPKKFESWNEKSATETDVPSKPVLDEGQEERRKKSHIAFMIWCRKYVTDDLRLLAIKRITGKGSSKDLTVEEMNQVKSGLQNLIEQRTGRRVV